MVHSKEASLQINKGTDKRNWIGKCMIQIEMAGQRTPPTVELVPDELRALASYVTDVCLAKNGYTGGFVTGNLNDMKGWLTSPDGEIYRAMPYYTSFPTISISNPYPEYYSPGNYDPEMANVFSQAEFDAAKTMPVDSRMAKTLRTRGNRLLAVHKEMEPRGKRVPWWKKPDGRPRMEEPMAEGNATADALMGASSAGVVLPGSGDGGGVGTQTARKARRRRRSSGAQVEGIEA
ncbi:MAG: hypothetical protein Q9170_005182 [Blastenia crenularia]